MKGNSANKNDHLSKQFQNTIVHNIEKETL